MCACFVNAYTHNLFTEGDQTLNTYLPVAMSATAHVADLKKIIADATEALKAIQMASAKTEKAAPTPLDASKTTACARASNQLTSTHTTPTAADDDDEWVWTPWDERIDGPSFLTSRHSLSPADAVTAHEDLSWCNPLACANSAPAKGNASDTGHSDTLGVRSPSAPARWGWGAIQLGGNLS